MSIFSYVKIGKYNLYYIGGGYQTTSKGGIPTYTGIFGYKYNIL